MSIEQVQHDALKRANFQCEKTYKYNNETHRCCEKHGTLAKTFKGKVILLPTLIVKKDGIKLDNIKMLCWKHVNDLERRTAKTKKRAKKFDPAQTDMFLPQQEMVL